MSVDDEKYLLSELAGNAARRAFTTLYDKYAHKCQAFAYAMTKDSTVAKDITHDIFLRIWLKRDLVSKVDSFSSYLFRMIRNAVLDHYESNAINRRFEISRLYSTEEFRDYVEEKVNLNELQVLIFNAVNSMPEQRKRIFMLSRYKGLTNKEISSMLGINVRTVENHITNALADIRNALSGI